MHWHVGRSGGSWSILRKLCELLEQHTELVIRLPEDLFHFPLPSLLLIGLLR